MGNSTDPLPNNRNELNLYIGRASAKVRCGLLADAAKDLAKATALNPMSDAAWYGFAVLLAAMNQQSNYLSDAHVGKSSSVSPSRLIPIVAERMARIAMLTRTDTNNFHPAGEWADHAAEVDYMDANLSGRQLTESLALYRRGKFAEAIEWSGKALASAANQSQPGWTHEQAGNRKAAAWFLQAMACQKLQEADKAQAVLAKGMEVAQTELPAFDGGDPGRDWPDRVIVEILQQETKAMMP